MSLTPAVSIVISDPDDVLLAAVRAQTLHHLELVSDFSQAQGAWVLFARPGQVLERHAVKNLLLVGEEHGADVVVGAMRDAMLPRVLAHHEFVQLADHVVVGDALFRRDWLKARVLLLDELANGVEVIPSQALHEAGLIVTIPQFVRSPELSPRIAPPAASRRPLLKDLPAIAFFIARLLPLRDELLFDVEGTRAIDSALVDLGARWQREHPRTRQHWISSTTRHSWRHAWHLGRARWLVANETFLNRIPKRTGQRMLIAGCALPILRTGRDNPDWVLQPTSERRPAWSQVGRWDLATAPSAFAEQVLRSSTAYVGQTVDGTVFGDAVALAAGDSTLRDRLGLDGHRPVVLLAFVTAEQAPDLAEVATALSERVQLVAMTDDGSRLGQVQGVQQVSADAASWCAAADVLVTDWSVLTLEFARLQRPIIGLQPHGLDMVRRRGTYLDLHEQLPGPILGSSAELVAQLEAWLVDGAAAVPNFEQRSSAFAHFAGPADGHTAARLWQALAGAQ
ncbi:MAG: CDP-glycerol glycerophosphotransferase family protein [Candidatus Nanopelagicales bacterium]